MHFAGVIFALVASASMVTAAPSANNGISARGCPNGWTYCGTCNGSSCKIAGINYGCESGTSCEGNGGGDGKICGGGTPTPGVEQICPVKT